MKDFTDEKSPEKYIWLNKNPTHFVDIKFSKDFKIMIGKVDNNNLMEELEKDKYYYDTYETNYLYNEYEADVKTTINNYSINKRSYIII